MRSKEAQHPFYRPLWIRVCLVGVLIAWSAMEWINDQPFWGVLTGAASLWAIWTFFLSYDPSEPGTAVADAGAAGTPASGDTPKD